MNGRGDLTAQVVKDLILGRHDCRVIINGCKRPGNMKSSIMGYWRTAAPVKENHGGVENHPAVRERLEGMHGQRHGEIRSRIGRPGIHQAILDAGQQLDVFSKHPGHVFVQGGRPTLKIIDAQAIGAGAADDLGSIQVVRQMDGADTEHPIRQGRGRRLVRGLIAHGVEGIIGDGCGLFGHIPQRSTLLAGWPSVPTAAAVIPSSWFGGSFPENQGFRMSFQIIGQGRYGLAGPGQLFDHDIEFDH